MATNPIQKERNNAIILGAVIGLIIGAVLTLLVGMIINPDILSISGTSKDAKVEVSVLNKDIKSGNEITSNDVSIIKVQESMVSTDYVVNGTIKTGSTAKVNLAAGTVLAKSMINEPTETVKNDVRQQEYNMISLPTALKNNDFVDIRLLLPSGQDFIVIAKKRVVNCNDTTIWMNLDEEETLAMSNAIVEHYIMLGSKLYATRYTDAGLQNQTTVTYTPNQAVTLLISGNANIPADKKSNGQGRYIQALKDLRNSTINSELNKYDETGLKNLETKIEEEIKNLKEARSLYFSNLNSAS